MQLGLKHQWAESSKHFGEYKASITQDVMARYMGMGQACMLRAQQGQLLLKAGVCMWGSPAAPAKECWALGVQEDDIAVGIPLQILIFLNKKLIKLDALSAQHKRQPQSCSS